MKPLMKKSPPIQKGEPKFLYTSVCCNLNAAKVPCVRVDKKTAETQGLGTFRCSGCRKACACHRVKNPLDKLNQQE
jgi:hypothetical protein